MSKPSSNLHTYTQPWHPPEPPITHKYNDYQETISTLNPQQKLNSITHTPSHMTHLTSLYQSLFFPFNFKSSEHHQIFPPFFNTPPPFRATCRTSTVPQSTDHHLPYLLWPGSILAHPTKPSCGSHRSAKPSNLEWRKMAMNLKKWDFKSFRISPSFEHFLPHDKICPRWTPLYYGEFPFNVH